jgi:Na+/proline symporter
MQGVDLLGLYLSSHLLWVGVLMLFVALYSSLSGMWGISLTDTFQFVIAMTGCIVLAIVVVNHSSIGGMQGLKDALPASYFSYLPSFSSEVQTGGKMLQMSLVALVAYLGVQWWASWYPGAEPGGGGYIAQRIMSAKNEKHSLFATLWFQIAHFAIRPWPWIIVALAALVLYPDATDKGATYVMVIRDFMPSGLMGLLLAAFLAAYMSTLASQTNWGTSYIINDLFKPYIKPGADEQYYVRISRITTVVLLIFSLLVSTQFDRISDAWKFILACSGGIGLVLILRWYWWRINAWSEIAAMLAPYAVYPFLVAYGFSFESTLLIIVAWSSLVWIGVTFLTKPVEMEKLGSFYRKIHPGGPGWKPVAVLNPDVVPDSGLIHWFVNWIVGCCMVLSFLFGAGYLLFGHYLNAAVAAIICITAAFIIIKNLKKGGIFGIQNS